MLRLWRYILRSVGNEAGILPLLLAGAALSAGGSYLGNQKKTITDPYGTLSPEARRMYKAIGPITQANATASPESLRYTGEFSAPISPGEQSLVDQNSRLNAIAEKGFGQQLSGEFPEDYYQQAIYKPMMKQFQEDVQPQIEEQYAGSGGYWGGARADAVRKGYRDVTDTLAAKRAELGYQARRDVGTAASAYANYQRAGADIQGIPRSIAQYGLDQKYKDYIAANDRSQAYIDKALNFLNIDTVSTTTKDKYGFLPYAMGAVGNAMMMSSASTGGSAAPGKSPGLDPNKVIW